MSEKDFETLVKELHHDDEWIALEAAKELNKLNDPRAVPHFIQELDYNARMGRFDQVMEERRKVGAPTYMFWEWHGVYLSDLRSEVARGLYALLREEAVPLLMNVLEHDSDFDVCLTMTYLLINVASDEVVETLDRCLQRAYDSTKYTDLVYLLRAFNRIDTPKAKEIVKSWVDRIGPVL